MKFILSFVLCFFIVFFHNANQFCLRAQSDENGFHDKLIDNDSTQPDNDSELRDIMHAYKYYQERNWEKAKEEFEKLVSTNPSSYRAHLILGNIYSFLDHYDKSISQYQTCIRLEKKRYHPYFNLGLVYMDMKNYAQAIKYFEITDSIIPDDFRVIFKIGESYFEMGEYEKALQYFKKTELINNQYHKNLLRMAEAYRKLNRFEEESQVYRNLIAQKPTFTAYYMLGLSRYSLKDHQGEIEAYKKALEYKFDKGVVYNLGVAYYEIGKLEEALNELSKIAFSDGQANADAIYYMAIIYINQGDLSKAWEMHDKLSTLSVEKADEIYEILKKR